MNTNRFRQLLESTLGNVKPLISEATEPPVGDEPGEGKVEITPQDKENVKSFLYDKVMEVPEIHTELGITSHDTKETVLDKLSHIHTHIDPVKKHLEIELPGFGVHHSIKPTIGLGYGSHGSSHGGGHDSHGMTTPTLSTLQPHSLFDVGVKLSLGDIFGKGNSSH